jgi:putative ABC transport system permease protein
MRQLRAILLRLTGLFDKSRGDREFSEELESHLQLQIDDNLRAGMMPDEARRQALIALGGIDSATEQYRDIRGLPVVETILQDVRYALRMMRRNPGFTIVVVLTMALGIGANSAIFTIINGVLLRRLPFPDTDRLISSAPRHDTFGLRPATWPDYVDWRDQSTRLEGLAGAWSQAFNVTRVDEPERLAGNAVTTNYFSILGARPQIGRVFTADDDRNADVVVLSHQLWQRRFGGARDAIGRSIDLNGRPYVIVGVMPPGFPFIDAAELWTPFVPAPEEGMDRGYPLLSVVGRLRRDATIADARAELTAIAARAAAAYPNTNTGWGVEVSSLQESLVGSTRRPLVILLGAVVCVLLIACVNVAALVLARSAARDHELTVRAALGASRSRLVRQLLTEGVVLSLCGGVAGLGLAAASLEPLLAMTTLPRTNEIVIDGSVLLFTLAAAMATGLLSGLAPALTTSRPDLQASLSVRGSTASGSNRLRPALVAAEIAAAVVLLAGAGLLIRSFDRLQQVETGFSGERVLTMRFFLPDIDYPNARRVQLFQQMIERVSALPGVERAAAVSALPFAGASAGAVFQIPGRPPAAPGEALSADFLVATPDYFGTMGIPLFRGRDFTDADRSDSQFVAIVNRSMADRFFPGEDPIGRSVEVLGPRPRTIVGVVQDVRERTLDRRPEPHIYVPHTQRPAGGMFLAVRARAGDPAGLAATVRAEVRALDPNLPIGGAQTWAELLGETLAARRFSLVLLTMFAGTALVLSIVGVYGVLSFMVSQRTREIGIRMALGAASRDVLALIVRQGLQPVVVGLLAGIPIALVATRALQTMLFEVQPNDPLTFAATALLLVGAALAATLVPARRAARVEPMVALRQE